MDDKELEKKFHDKKFLRSNDFAAAMGKVIVFCRENKNMMFVALIVFALIATAIPGFKWYRLKRVGEFNQKLYAAQTSLKKEPLLRGLMTDYRDLPAKDYVRLALVGNLLDHNQEDEALKIIDEGLQGPEANIYSTLLVMKKLNILKTQGKFAKAAQAATDHQAKILETFVNQYKIINAELYLLAGDRAAARALYHEIGSFAGFGAEAATLVEGFDPVIANHAKDMVLLMDLDVI